MKYSFMRFPEGKSKALTLSYDDGLHQDIKLSEILSQHGIKCTFNLTSGSLKGAPRLTPQEVSEYILNKGHEIALHGSQHRAEGKIRPIEGIRDILDIRLELEREFGTIIRGMAYPDSGISIFMNPANYETVRRYLKDLDITYARTLGGDNDSFLLPQDWYAWMPTAHHTNPHIFEYIDKFLAIDVNAPNTYIDSRYSRLFYLWGHSYEFDRNDNWDLIEKICDRLAFHEDIWYATNTEIYDYVTAYNSLIYSADGTRVYNPTLHTIWFDTDRNLYTIHPGETIIRPN